MGLKTTASSKLDFLNNPTDWGRFDAVQPNASELQKMGVTEKRADFYRWASRFRIAKSFERIQLLPSAKMGVATQALLDAVFRVFLTYSAFEQFIKVAKIGTTEDDLRKLQDAHNQSSVISRIRAVEPGYEFFRFTQKELDPQHAKRMKEFIAGNHQNVSFLGKSIRHLLAHGKLTPSSGGVDVG